MAYLLTTSRKRDIIMMELWVGIEGIITYLCNSIGFIIILYCRRDVHYARIVSSPHLTGRLSQCVVRNRYAIAISSTEFFSKEILCYKTGSNQNNQSQ